MRLILACEGPGGKCAFLPNFCLFVPALSTFAAGFFRHFFKSRAEGGEAGLARFAYVRSGGLAFSFRLAYAFGVSVNARNARNAPLLNAGFRLQASDLMRECAAVEKAFCVAFGNSEHVDVARKQQALIAVPHIELEPREVSKIFCMVACIRVPQDVLHPRSGESGFVPYRFPAAVPAGRNPY